MAVAVNSPIVVREALTLTSLGIAPQFITFAHVTMESDKYICVRETSPQDSIVIIDMAMPMEPLRRPITADSALMNPNSRILALKARIPGTAQDHMQIFNLEDKTMMKSHRMREPVVFSKWITPKLLGLVTRASVYHWSSEGDAEPIKMFDRTANLANNQIINYRCDPTEKWLALIGIAPGAPEKPQLVKGNMQLFSVDLQRSQALEVHAASFATFKVPGNENPSTLICFASKTFYAGQITSKLHVIELGAQPGKPGFSRKQADLLFPPDFQDDFPVAMQISQKYGLIYIITKLSLLYVFDLETAAAVYRNRISSDPMFLTAESSTTGGFYAVSRRGQVLHVTVNDATIVPFVSGQLDNLELAVSLAKRANLPGAEHLAVQRFQELFAQTKYKEAAELAADSPQGLLRTPETFAKFQSVSVQAGQTHPLLQYFGVLLARGKLNAYESLELSRLVVTQNKKNLLENWLGEDKLECSEELGDIVKTVDNVLAQKIYIKAWETPKSVVGAFAERKEFDKILVYPEQQVSSLKGPGETSYKVYNDEESILSSSITSGPSSGMSDLASELEALECILSDTSAGPAKLSYALIKSITDNFSKVIGHGGFAVVYQGVLRNGKVAVKKLSISNGFSDQLFVDEIECLTRAKHNNVVRYLGYCADTQGELMEFNGRCVIAEVPKRLLCFEYVPNGSLHRYLKEKPRGDDWQIRYQMIKGICQGLQHLHKIRINHLDLKPGNILLDVHMEPKITDFGLSRFFDEEQSRIFTKNICGTPGYIAPEIINGGEISFKSDIFALGIIIIKLLTGRNNYDIENWHESLNVDCPQVRSCIGIAQACVDDDHRKRPTIGEIIDKLNKPEIMIQKVSQLSINRE